MRCGESACERHFIFKDPFRKSLMTSFFYPDVGPPMADLSTVFSHLFRSYGSQVHATNRYTELSNFPANREWKTLEVATPHVMCPAQRLCA
jgi:hypothetical protein